MDKNTLLVKTEKGRDALARRSPELVPRLRSMLILVDGKRSVAELDKLGGGLGDATSLLEQLLAHEWIAVSAPGSSFQTTVPFLDSRPFRTTAPSPVSPLEAAPLERPQALSFPEARRLVVRFINDAVGPMGETVAIRVESCKSAEELQAQLPRIRDALQNYRNLATVQRFNLEVVPQLPRS